MSEQEQTTESVQEISQFEKALADIKSQPLTEYCEADIIKIKCDLGLIKCAVVKAKEKISQSVGCSTYNWQTKTKPKIISKFDSLMAAIDKEIKKLDESLKRRSTEINEKLPELKEKYSRTYLRGWEPDDYKEE